MDVGISILCISRAVLTKCEDRVSRQCDRSLGVTGRNACETASNIQGDHPPQRFDLLM